jgi:hypothetical protein
MRIFQPSASGSGLIDTRPSSGMEVSSPVSSAPALPSLAQQAVATRSDGTPSAGLVAATGNSIIACISYLSTDTLNIVPNYDDGNGDLIQGPAATVAGVTSEIWYRHNVDAGSRVGFATNMGLRASLNASEWTPLTNAAPEDTDSNTGVASSTVTTNSVTPVSTRSLVIAMYASVLEQMGADLTNGGFTPLTSTGGTGAFQHASYKVLSVIAATSTSVTLSADNWVALIAAFGSP